MVDLLIVVQAAPPKLNKRCERGQAICAFRKEHYRRNNLYLHQELVSETTLMPNAPTVFK